MENNLNKNNLNSEKETVKKAAPPPMKKAAPPPMKKGSGLAEPKKTEMKKEIPVKEEKFVSSVADKKEEKAVPPVEKKEEKAVSPPVDKKEETVTPPAETKEEMAVPTPAEAKEEKAVPLPVEKKEEKTPSSPAEKKDNKKNLKIIIPIIAIVAVAIIIAVALSSCKDKNEPIVVTDSNGVPITDVNGDVITVIPETEVVPVTDEFGNVLKDANGNPLTTTAYKDITVGVPVTDMNGALVTDASGNAVTQNIQVKPTGNSSSNETEKQNVLGTTIVPFTDGQGNTGVDSQGNLITTIIDVTSNTLPNIEPAKTEWKNTLGGTKNDRYADVILTSDGCYITANVTNSKDGDFSKYKELNYKIPYTVLTKYDKNGAVVWEKALGDPKGLLELSSLSPCSDGSFYAAGHGVVIGNEAVKGYYDGAIYKIDKNGNIIWTKAFGTTTVDSFNDITVTKDGGVVAVGFVSTNDGDAQDSGGEAYKSKACIVKYSASGKLLWKNYVGGDRDQLLAVAEATDGSLFVTGSFVSDKLFENRGKADAAAIKYSKDGKRITQTAIAGTGVDSFKAIMPTSDGGVIVAGHSDSSDTIEQSFFKNDFASKGGFDAFIIKYDNNLKIKFVTPLRGQNNDTVESITELSNGTFIVAGSSNSSSRDFKGVTTRGMKDIFIAAFNQNGDLCWVRSFGGTMNETALALCRGADGGYVVAGETFSNDVDLSGIAPFGGNGQTVGIIIKFPE